MVAVSGGNRGFRRSSLSVLVESGPHERTHPMYAPFLLRRLHECLTRHETDPKGPMLSATFDGATSPKTTAHITAPSAPTPPTENGPFDLLVGQDKLYATMTESLWLCSRSLQEICPPRVRSTRRKELSLVEHGSNPPVRTSRTNRRRPMSRSSDTTEFPVESRGRRTYRKARQKIEALSEPSQDCIPSMTREKCTHQSSN